MNLAQKYRSAWCLALFVGLLCVAIAVIDAIGIQMTTTRIYVLDCAKFGANIPVEQAEVVDSRQRFLGLIQLSVVLIEVVLFLAWIYRSNCNARALGAAGMKYSPGWSVGWFLVPIASLFMPYWVVKEIWQASSPTPHGRWHQTIVSPLLGLWWGVTVLCGMIQYSRWPCLLGQGRTALALEFLSHRSDEVPRFGVGLLDSELEWSWGLLIGDLVGIAVVILTVVIVMTITALQDRKHANLADLEFSQDEAHSPDGVVA